MNVLRRLLRWLGGGPFGDPQPGAASEWPEPVAPFDLTGVWTGEYVQWKRTFAISAELVQEGQRLNGTMRDGETAFTRPLAQAAAEGNWPLHLEEELVAHLRRKHPEHGGKPLGVRQRHDEESTLAGRVRGKEVYFLKTYRSSTVIEYLAGDAVLESAPVPGHTVTYQGEVNRHANLISGRWSIGGGPDVPGASGEFRLRRGRHG